jgi:alkanesulfonate monooxygenase SsuD/methylene tetrahydromethanopterin reductase-like flavin-dependent oxidoreductase (luciferase family)
MTYTFGLDTFGDRNSDADGKPLSHAQTIRNVVEEGVFAEQAGLDFFGIGEHHTEYFPMPAGDVVGGGGGGGPRPPRGSATPRSSRSTRPIAPSARCATRPR